VRKYWDRWKWWLWRRYFFRKCACESKKSRSQCDFVRRNARALFVGGAGSFNQIYFGSLQYALAITSNFCWRESQRDWKNSWRWSICRAFSGSAVNFC